MVCGSALTVIIRPDFGQHMMIIRVAGGALGFARVIFTNLVVGQDQGIHGRTQ
jgi:hypothetical protein